MTQSSKPSTVFKLRIIIEADEDRFHAYCPALKGLHVDGSTKEEALENAKEAAMAYIQSLIKHGDPIPINIIPPHEESKRVLHLFRRQMQQHTEDLQLTVS